MANPRREKSPLVLVVEDDLDTVAALSAYLESVGFTVLAATNGAEALNCARSSAPAIVVADMGMPDMDGYEMCRRLRSHSRSLPILAVTGWCTKDDIQKAVDAGCNLVLCKPCVPEALVAAMRRLLLSGPHPSTS